MSIHRRFPRPTIGLLILVGTLWAAVTSAPGAFTPFVPQALPQRAWGDFDGDGRPDVALIQDGADGPRVSVRLSGSARAVMLEAKVASLIAADIDHDGDVDLVAVAPSGQVMIWLNDGRGRFMLQEALHSHSLSPAATFVTSSWVEPAGLGATAPLVGPSTRNDAAVVVTDTRPPTIPLAFDLSVLFLPGLRAPPISISLH